MRHPWLALTLVALLLVPALGQEGVKDKTKRTVELDFSQEELPADWSVTGKAWKVEDGELRGTGWGYLEYKPAFAGDFTLTFRAWTEEKANIEIQLWEPEKRKKTFYTYAFLGRYHTVLDGVKCALLREQYFVSVNSRMWIFPGRFFDFEVRAAANQHQMFLNSELGPFFRDEKPPKDMKDYLLRIIFVPQSPGDSVRFDDVKLVRPE